MSIDVPIDFYDGIALKNLTMPLKQEIIYDIKSDFILNPTFISNTL